MLLLERRWAQELRRSRQMAAREELRAFTLSCKCPPACKRRNSSARPKKMLRLECYATLAPEQAATRFVRRYCTSTIQVLSSFAAPDIAGRASIGALPQR